MKTLHVVLIILASVGIICCFLPFFRKPEIEVMLSDRYGKGFLPFTIFYKDQAYLCVVTDWDGEKPGVVVLPVEGSAGPPTADVSLRKLFFSRREEDGESWLVQARLVQGELVVDREERRRFSHALTFADDAVYVAYSTGKRPYSFGGEVPTDYVIDQVYVGIDDSSRIGEGFDGISALTVEDGRIYVTGGRGEAKMYDSINEAELDSSHLTWTPLFSDDVIDRVILQDGIVFGISKIPQGPGEPYFYTVFGQELGDGTITKKNPYYDGGQVDSFGVRSDGEELVLWDRTNEVLVVVEVGTKRSRVLFDRKALIKVLASSG